MPTRICPANQIRIERSELQGWANVPVTIMSDITSGSVLVDPRIKPLRAFALGNRMAGQVVTAWCERADFGPVLHAIDLAGEGDIVAIDAGGSLETAFVGELLCGAARRKKVGGLIVNGAVRDIDTIASWNDFPVYCLGTTARGPLSKERGTVNDTIIFGGISLKPGDIVLGDNDGLVVIAAEKSKTLLALGQERVRMEEQWAAQLATGRKLIDVFSVPEAV